MERREPVAATVPSRVPRLVETSGQGNIRLLGSLVKVFGITFGREIIPRSTLLGSWAGLGTTLNFGRFLQVALLFFSFCLAVSVAKTLIVAKAVFFIKSIGFA